MYYFCIRVWKYEKRLCSLLIIMMIEIKDAVLRNSEFIFSKPVSLTIERGEHIAFIGSNGGGKSVMAQMITGKYPLKKGHISLNSTLSPVYKNIKFISFKDSYGPVDSSYYLQQRWNSQDSEDSPSVRDVLAAVMGNDYDDTFLSLLGVDKMLDKQLVLLSSGEMRKFQLTKALLNRPRILIIDNPFIGLDVDTRALLCDFLGKLAGMGNVQIILLLSKADEIPDFVTHIVPVNNLCCGKKTKRCDFRDVKPEIPVIDNLYLSEMPVTGYLPPEKVLLAAEFSSVSLPNLVDIKSDNDIVIDMRNVTVKYGEHTILDSLNWTVRRGEKWSLLGKNGSGKSTLLSLVCADNPQGYACDITLFGSRRGSGESIWEIKKRIGYVSPEMHRSYSENIPAINIVASGLHDSIGLYVRPKPGHFAVCEWWMNIFGILHLRDRMFLQLSDGEQRMVLLARAFVKDPELLILDEPFHGLDTRNHLLVQSIIEAFCRRPGKTFIMVTHYEHELPECINKSLVLSKMN